MLKAVLFDMDDTLLDWSTKTLDWYEHEREQLERVFRYICDSVHKTTVAIDSFYQVVRQHARDAWAQALQEYTAPRYADALLMGLYHLGVPANLIDMDACWNAFGWGLISGVTVFPDVPEVLDMLFAQGLQLGLVTNSSVPMRFRDRELEQVNILHYFANCRLSAADVGYIKPHARIFEAALDRLGIRAEEAVFVGDNPEADISGAQRVGMRAALRLIEGRTYQALDEGFVRPDGVIFTFHDLLPLLDQWYPKWRRAAA